jgi:peroxiredoxin
MRSTLGTEGGPRLRPHLVRLAVYVTLTVWVLIELAIGWRLWFAPTPPVHVLPTATRTLLVEVMPTDTAPLPATLGPQPGPFVGDLAPDFRLPTLDGGSAALSDHRGHRVLVNFFATWCDPCRAEMPGLEAQAQKHTADEWVVLGVDVMESREALSAFRAEFGLTFPLLRDENAEVARQYLVTGTPTSLFIDRAGRVVERREGYMSESELATVIESMP